MTQIYAERALLIFRVHLYHVCSFRWNEGDCYLLPRWFGYGIRTTPKLYSDQLRWAKDSLVSKTASVVNFEQNTKDSWARISKWGAKYFTHNKSYFPTMDFESINLAQPRWTLIKWFHFETDCCYSTLYNNNFPIPIKVNYYPLYNL